MINKILAIRNDRFGEFLLNIPAFRAIKETFPGTRLDVVVAPHVECLASAVPFIDNVFVRPLGAWSWRKNFALMGRLRSEKYDAALVLNPTRAAHHMVFWAGIPVRAGYARKHHFLLTRTIEDLKSLGMHHEVDHNLELVRLIGAVTNDKSLALTIPEDIQASVWQKFNIDPAQPLIFVHPWTSDPVKQWPLENFARLLERVAAGFNVKVIVIGRPEGWHQDVVFNGANVVDLHGRTTLLEAAALLSRGKCLISCDSGPVHLAAAVGTSVVALFRNDMPGKGPQRWGPWGSGHTVVQKPGLESILVEEVYEALSVHLARQGIIPSKGSRAQ